MLSSALRRIVCASSVNGKMSYSTELYAKFSKQLQTKLGKDLVEPFLRPGFQVLDVGCGTGELSLEVCDIVGPNGSLYGIDPDKERIQIAKERSKDIRNATFVVGKGSDAELLKQNGKFDVAYCNFVFHWLEDGEKLSTLKAVYKLLKPEAKFVIQYIDRFPEVVFEMAAILDQLELFNKHFLPASVEIFSEMSKQAGFVILRAECLQGETKWNSLLECAQFITAASSGIVDFTKVVERVGIEAIDLPSLFRKNGIIEATHATDKIILQKPKYQANS